MMALKYTLFGTLRCLAGLVFATLLCCSDACNIKSYEARCHSCVASLVETWKTNPKANCSAQYLQFKQCIKRHEVTCLASPEVTNHTAGKIRRMSRVYIVNETFFCQDGMFDSMKYMKYSRLSISRSCSKKLFRRATKCGRHFLPRFLKNRGSKTLCRRYNKAKHCMVKAIKKHCKGSRLSTLLMRKYLNPYNPYCKNKVDPFRLYKPGGFGRCTRKSYIVQSRECIKNFVQSLQRSNGRNCRALVNSHLLACTKTRIKRCLKGGRDERNLDRAIEKRFDSKRRYQMQNIYCEGGFLSTMRLRADQCQAEYFETFQGKCYAKFKSMYIKNRADPKLCQYYAEVKKCARNMTLSMCTLNENLKDEMFFHYGEFNPFCSDGKDPVVHRRRALNANSKTILESSNIVLSSSIVTLVLSVCFRTLLN